MNLLVTGGCGFLGAHFIRGWLAKHPEDRITNIDCLTYAGSIESLEEVRDHPHHRHLNADVADAEALRAAWDTRFDLVVHFAAETHVDRSLEDAGRFVRTNVLGTQTVLASALSLGATPVVVISSDEVYGPTPDGTAFEPDQPLGPTSPYAASKAAADEIAAAYREGLDLDVTIVRSVNVYGPRQYPEKLIPLFTARALTGQPLPLYGDGRQRRSWLYIDDFVDGLLAILADTDKRREAPVWHLGSDDEWENRRIADEICRFCGVDRSLITSVSDRPGHDRRYALDFAATTRAFGWRPRVKMAEGLNRTTEWIRDNLDWCRSRLGWTPEFLRAR